MVVLIIGINVVGRALNMPIPGGFDLSMLCAAVSGSLAIAYSTKCGAHVSVDIITNILPPRLRKVQELIISLFVLFIFVILSWQAVVVFIERFHGEVTETLRIPFWPFRLIWIISMVSSILFCLSQLALTIFGGEE